MIEKIILEKGSMGFKLPDGKVFLLHSEDVKKISDDLYMHIMTMQQEKVFMLRDTGFERANKLYEIYQKEKLEMSEKAKQACLARIVKFLSDDNYDLTTLKALVAEHQNKSK